MICYLVDSWVNNRKCLRIGCKNNNSLVLPIDLLEIKSLYYIIKYSASFSYLSNIIKGLSLDNQ